MHTDIHSLLALFLWKTLTNVLYFSSSLAWLPFSGSAFQLCLTPTHTHSLTHPSLNHLPAVPLTHRPIISLQLPFAKLPVFPSFKNLPKSHVILSRKQQSVLPRMGPFSGIDLRKKTLVLECCFENYLARLFHM